MANELQDLKVEFISLVDRPANRKELVLKSAKGIESARIVKIDDEMRRAYGIVYAPDEVDAQDDFASAATIRKAADDFMRAGSTGNVDVQHDFEKLDEVWVAESWIVRKGDALFAEEGAWAVGIQVDNAKVWAKLKAGELAGLSLAGFGKRKDKPEDDNVEEQVKQLEARLGGLEAAINALQKAEDKTEEGEHTDGGGNNDKQAEIALSAFFAKMEKRLDELELSVLRKGRNESGQGGNAETIPEGFL
jgi:hypothetical protein